MALFILVTPIGLKIQVAFGWSTLKEEIILLEVNMGTANGIEVSPDGKKLYVNESVSTQCLAI